MLNSSHLRPAGTTYEVSAHNPRNARCLLTSANPDVDLSTFSTGRLVDAILSVAV
jgi:hypothetical protein